VESQNLLYKVILTSTKFTGAGLVGGILKVILFLNVPAFVIASVLVGTGVVVTLNNKELGKVDTVGLTLGTLLGLLI
jgi:hypothetical protein